MSKFSAQDFSTGSVYKHLINLAVPMTAAMIVQVCYSLVDRIYLGHLSDTSNMALTGLGLSFPLISIVMAFTSLFSTGATPLFSMYRGRHDPKTAQKIIDSTYAMILFFAAGLMLVFYTGFKPIIYLFGGSDLSYPYAKDYLLIYLLGTPLVMLSSGLSGFINAQGFPKVAMLSVMTGAVINIILDPIFIFYLDLKIQGAAVASVISQAVSAFMVIRFLTGKKSLFKLKLNRLKPDFKLCRQIVGLGVTGFTMQGTNGIVQIACNVTLRAHGGDIYIGIMTVLMSVRDVIFLPMHGLTDAAKPIIAFNYGAGLLSRIKQSICFTAISATSYLFICWLIIFLNPEIIFTLFNADINTITLGVPALHIYFFGFFMMALHATGQTAFVGLGKAKPAVFFALFRKVLIVVPLTIILPEIGNLGVKGVFMAEPISNWISGICCFGMMLYTVKILFKEHRRHHLATTEKE